MTPFEYVTQYHDFTVVDARLGLSVQTKLTGYNNHYSAEGDKQVVAITSALARKYFRGKTLSSVFSIPGEPRIDSSQHFSVGSLRRAFQSRGSPYEFRHALRLAFLAGQCEAPGKPSAAAYAAKWFTNDCVSFAANYSGVSPSTPVFAYALGLSDRMLKAPGVTADVRLSAPIVQLPPRTSAADIQQGDLLLTLSVPDTRGIAWRHIAVVQDFSPLAGDAGLLSIAEWGWNVAADHTVRGRRVSLHDGSKGDRKAYAQLQAVRKQFVGGGDVVAFDGRAPGPGHPPALRIFFDASRFQDLDSRGYLVAGQPAPN
ncbi:MAG: hypothetical protein JNM25_16805 [Planctomycetes bacterium]|nr:hypothetical protein [Planctomycetota bacterium]